MSSKVSMELTRMLFDGSTGSSLVLVMRYADSLLYSSTVITIFHVEHSLLEFQSIFYYVDILKTTIIISFWANLFLNLRDVG